LKSFTVYQTKFPLRTAAIIHKSTKIWADSYWGAKVWKELHERCWDARF